MNSEVVLLIVCYQARIGYILEEMPYSTLPLKLLHCAGVMLVIFNCYSHYNPLTMYLYNHVFFQ